MDPVSLHKYLYGGASPLDRADPSGLMLTSSDMLGALASIQILAAIALPKIGSVWSAITANWLTIQAIADKTLFWVDVATTTLGAAQEAAFRVTEAMDRMASVGMNTHVEYPAGDCARGTRFGQVVNQNLADSFPAIDHFEGGAAISIKTTVTTDMPGKFVDTVGQWAAQLSGLEDPVEGYTASGQWVELDPKVDFKARGLLVAIPHEGLAWHPSTITWVNSQLRQIGRNMNVAIRLVPVRGLRGE